MKNSVLLVCVLMIFLASISLADDDFYGYYTRLDYMTPLYGLDYIPTELSEESKQILREMERLSGEEEEEEELDEEEEEEFVDEERRDFSKDISGQFADIVIQVGSKGKLVFSRETSYLPYWKTDKGQWNFKKMLPRQEDVACLYSYVRIIENTPDKVLVHWRYIPELNNPSGFTSVVHEYFEITKQGTVIRRMKKATGKLDEYNDPGNMTVQKLKLRPEGIKQISLQPASVPKPAGQIVEGAPVKNTVITKPSAWWKFDEGLETRPYESKDIAVESISSIRCPVEGNITLWKKGISGTALAFDGYDSKVTLDASKAPEITDELTVEAWVVLGAYPWNWAPLVHRSIVDTGPIERGTYDERGQAVSRKPGRGYYLGVGPYGHPVFVIDDKELKADVKLPTYRWAHIVGVYGNGKMRLYVDGKERGSLSATGKINVPDTDLIIGLNNVKGRATDPVREPICHMPIIYGIEGLIDEVKVYNKALKDSDITDLYDYFKPASDFVHMPDLQPRTLPGETGTAEKFGAYYTKLKFHELWDNLWRTSDYPDLVVKFDNIPTSVVYWRGANGAAGWVTENNKWMEDQSCETGGPHGCSEHMADKQYRHAHVRLIENTDARVVIHWRYASIDIAYLFPSLRHWADEYHTIYPDGTGVRKVFFRGGNPGWQDVQFFTQPGTTCLDNVHLQAQTLANLEGKIRELTWAPPNRVPRNTLRDACIELINFKSQYKVFLIFQEGTYISPWGRQEQSKHTDDPFAGPWNHWPVSQIPSDGRYAVAHDRVTHAAIGAADNVVEHGNMAIYGFTDKDISTLVPLARMWNNPPLLESVKGCDRKGYSKEQLAYELVANGSDISFTAAASKDSPLVNPCFVIYNWDSYDKAEVNIDGESVKCEKKLRQGIIRDTKGKRALVVWFEIESEKPVKVSISKI